MSDLAIVEALRKRYPDPAFALLLQVANGTGAARARTADAIAFGLWPSRGLDVEGIEIKVSRSDWRRELTDPDKAASFWAYCHRWWVATIPGVVETGELPTEWGLLELKRGVLRQVIEAPRTPNPTPLTVPMVAAIARNLRKTELRAVEALRHTIAREARVAEREATQRLTDSINAFHAATGIDVRRDWDTPRLTAALAMIDNGKKYESVLGQLSYLKRIMRSLLEAIDTLEAAEGGR